MNENDNWISDDWIEVCDLSDEEFEALSPEERQAYLDNMDAWIKAEIEKDPHRAFLDLAIGSFDDVVNNRNDVTVKTFDYMAGMAVKHSDYSVLTEIAMTLMKIMLILRKIYPECNKLDVEIIGEHSDDNFYFRLFLLTRFIFELIDQERDGKLILDNALENEERELLLGIIDLAAQYDEIGKDN